MINRSLCTLAIGLWTLMLFSPVTVTAANLVNGNLSIQGNQCIGVDCVNDQVFTAPPMRLSENNTRIALRDLSASSHGFSWVLRANDSTNGGTNSLMLAWRSDTQLPVLSDGTAPDYDCTAPPDYTNPQEPFPVVGTIPAGEPIETATCAPVTDYTTHPALQLLPDGAVALGRGAATLSGQISVGGTELQRRIKHLSEAVQATDALVKRQMDAYRPLVSQRQQIQELNAQAAALEKQVAPLNRQLDAWRGKDGDGVGLGNGLWLLLGLLLAGARMERRRNQSL